ncbi:pyocin knob domain-containing protein [Paenibacillus thiaminolyticus]|uniref:pyocin knob domain-containing protein n=1 Tax=Paenibacillus thiaminolyticus TaxID=49283 RepID=UPI0035A5F4D4
MAETDNLKLYKADPIADADKTFNIDTMLNGNWDKIDSKAAEWDGKETPTGAQEKADDALTAAKAYTDEQVADIDLTSITPESIGAAKKTDFDAHVTDTEKHITVAERASWNQAEANAKEYVDAKPWQRHKVSDDAGNATVASDLNDDLTTGWYMGTNMANAPTSEWFWVEIIRHNHLWTVQNAYCFNRQSYFQRMKINGNWTAWSQDLFQSGVDAKQAIVDAINSKGGNASANDSWATLAAAIAEIHSGSALLPNISAYVRKSTLAEGIGYDTADAAVLPARTSGFVFTATRGGSSGIQCGGMRPGGIAEILIVDSSGASVALLRASSENGSYPDPLNVDSIFINVMERKAVVYYRRSDYYLTAEALLTSLNTVGPLKLQVRVYKEDNPGTGYAQASLGGWAFMA